MSMIERVARALCALDVIDHRLRQQYVDKTWREHIPDARAAIEAMREPTDAMIDAGDNQDDGTDSRAPAAWHWSAMIQAALEGGG